jgi:hypothetical protein
MGERDRPNCEAVSTNRRFRKHLLQICQRIPLLTFGMFPIAHADILRRSCMTGHVEYATRSNDELAGRGALAWVERARDQIRRADGADVDQVITDSPHRRPELAWDNRDSSSRDTTVSIESGICGATPLTQVPDNRPPFQS